MSIRRLGVHTSISGGIHLSLLRAKELGCNTVQIFSHNPRSWKQYEIDTESIRRFKELRQVYNISPVFVHTSYLINIASPDLTIRKKSMSLLINELKNAEHLGADYVVLHPGSSRNNLKAGKRYVCDILRYIGDKKDYSVRLLIENTAGESGDVGSTLDEISEIIERSDTGLIGGLCIDTCHTFQSGYDIKTDGGIQSFFKKVKETIGFEKIKLIHLNDSKREFNARVDRHENIGEGKIGKIGLKRFINYPAIKDVPLILETPKRDDRDDIRNLRRVRELL